jgi:hypothetical protein
MAKVKGIVQFSGTLGEFNFYLRKGQPVVRKAGGGFNGEAIKNAESMEKVRQNGSEFGQVSRMVKAFKTALAPLLHGVNYPDLHGRLVRLFIAVKNTDTVSPKGSRTLQKGLSTAEGKQLITGFCVPDYHAKLKLLSGLFYFDAEHLTLRLTHDTRIADLLPKHVDGVAVQVGILTFDETENACLLTLNEVVYLSRETTTPPTLPVLLETRPTLSLVVLSLGFYSDDKNGLPPVFLKGDLYLEVVGII